MPGIRRGTGVKGPSSSSSPRRDIEDPGKDSAAKEERSKELLEKIITLHEIFLATILSRPYPEEVKASIEKGGRSYIEGLRRDWERFSTTRKKAL